MRGLATRALCIALAIAICCTPEFVFAQSGQGSGTVQQPSASGNSTGQPAAPSGASIPDAPQSVQSPSTDSAAQPAQSSTSAEQQQPTEPEGTAAARAAKTIGGPASKPAGSAIAPAKQHQVRSLLIKLGAIAGAGAAIGTVYALTRGTPNKPPGAR